MAHDRFEVLFVCHANLCRSPMAERLANRMLADRIGVRGSRLVVSSVGTHARAGEPMHPAAAQVLRERGAYADRFESRLLTPPILAKPDLVLTATREQRAACLRMVPAAAHRTFTLLQFAALRVPALAGAGPGTGWTTGPVRPDDHNLADPVGGPVEAFRACAEEIERALDALIEVIAAR